MAHAGGRPTKLTPELVEQATKYLDDNEGFVNSLLPTIERLALTLKVHRDTLQEWEKTSPEFSVILERLRAIQADKLLQNGLTGRYNSTIAKLVLTKHGYVEKQDIDANVNASVTIQTVNYKNADTDDTPPVQP